VVNEIFRCSHASASELILQPELQDARISCRADAPESCASWTGRCRCHRADPFGKIEVRMVEEIEKFLPELQPVAIIGRHTDCHVDILKSAVT
jgi:hypothetical protein